MFHQTFRISKKEEGKRIDVLSAEKYPNISRSQWRVRGKFFCKNKERSSGTKVHSGESWRVKYEQKISLSEAIPWNFPLKVLAESRSWVVVEKPEGISVHPSFTDVSQKTIINALIFQFGKKLAKNFEEINGLKVPRFGLVHRLDKTTSGVLLVAKTKKTHEFLQKNWDKVEKIYYALVQGVPPERGKIEAGILRDANDRQRMAVGKGRGTKEATTFFEVKETQGKESLLKVRIPTGRTHQIRVHLSSIGFPILGDVKYGGRKADRVYLHAHSITFPDPDAKGAMRTVTSEIPKEFEKA